MRRRKRREWEGRGQKKVHEGMERKEKTQESEGEKDYFWFMCTFVQMFFFYNCQLCARFRHVALDQWWGGGPNHLHPLPGNKTSHLVCFREQTTLGNLTHSRLNIAALGGSCMSVPSSQGAKRMGQMYNWLAFRFPEVITAESESESHNAQVIFLKDWVRVFSEEDKGKRS